MPFNSNIPQANDQLSISQPQILGNFGSINTWVNVDHTGLNAGNYGQHNKVTFPLQGSTPSFGGLNGLWSQLYTPTGSVGELWLNHRNGNQYPMSASILSTTPALGNNGIGWTYWPSGLVMKWGIIAVNGSTNVNLNSIGPGFTAYFAAFATAISTPASNAWVVGITTAQLTLNCTTATNVYWMVLGRQ